jgi:hypothetical protein
MIARSTVVEISGAPSWFANLPTYLSTTTYHYYYNYYYFYYYYYYYYC